MCDHSRMMSLHIWVRAFLPPSPTTVHRNCARWRRVRTHPLCSWRCDTTREMPSDQSDCRFTSRAWSTTPSSQQMQEYCRR